VRAESIRDGSVEERGRKVGERVGRRGNGVEME